MFVQLCPDLNAISIKYGCYHLVHYSVSVIPQIHRKSTCFDFCCSMNSILLSITGKDRFSVCLLLLVLIFVDQKGHSY